MILSIVAGCGGGGEGEEGPEPRVTRTEDQSLIAGIDKNQDGIRDEVEAVIAMQAAENDPDGRALRDFAASIQSALLSAPHQYDISSPANTFVKALRCVIDVYGLEQARVTTAAIVDATVDSEARLRAYIDFNLRAGRYLSDTISSNPCS